MTAKKVRYVAMLALMILPLVGWSQVNPLLKKYAGTYYRLSHSEKTATSTSEKVVLIADGKLTSTFFPYEDEGVARVAQKRTGIWEANDTGLILSITAIDPDTKEANTFDEEYKLVEPEYRLLEGNFRGDSYKLIKVIVSNPAFVTKYAGNYHLVDYSREINEYTPTLALKADGTCLMTVLNNEPVKGKWKAIDGIIQLMLNQKQGEEMTEYNLKNGLFTDRQDYELKKVMPPPPPGLYLTKYAGTYTLLADGEVTWSKYVLKPDGTGTWTYSTTGPAVKGTWKASEGLMQLYFYPEGDGGKGSEMITDFKLEDGVFHAEHLTLKKNVAPAQQKK